MTDKQPEAIAYAVPLYELLDNVPRNERLIIDDQDGKGTRFIPIGRMSHEAAAELRRLHEVNAELVEALSVVIRGVPDTWEGVKQAKVVLDKAKEQNNG